MVSIIVSINGLCLQPGNGVELLDCCSPQAGQCTEHCTLDLGDLGILDGINQGVLRLRGMVLQLLGSVLLAEWRNLIEVHLQVVGHLLRQLVFRCSSMSFANSPHGLQEGDRLAAALPLLQEVVGQEGLCLGQQSSHAAQVSFQGTLQPLELLDGLLCGLRSLGVACFAQAVGLLCKLVNQVVLHGAGLLHLGPCCFNLLVCRVGFCDKLSSSRLLW
mmetsp:Transcript_4854/g.10718  ORF Transcript_4854/g.10718 Transcript_4854/m.10718 type:complete len:217 (-) Transcript_4854:184-834(-)